MKSCIGKVIDDPDVFEDENDINWRKSVWFKEWAEHDPVEQHWHLGPIGVLPSHRGMGVGTELMQRSLPILVCLAYLLVPMSSQALTVDGNYYALAGEFEYLTDPGGQLTLEDLLARPSQHPFNSSRDSKPEAGFEPVWLKLELDFTEAAQDRRYLLYGRLENIFDLRIYRPDGREITMDPGRTWIHVTPQTGSLDWR